MSPWETEDLWQRVVGVMPSSEVSGCGKRLDAVLAGALGVGALAASDVWLGGGDYRFFLEYLRREELRNDRGRWLRAGVVGRDRRKRGEQ